MYPTQLVLGPAGGPGEQGSPGGPGKAGQPGAPGNPGSPGMDAEYCPCPDRTKESVGSYSGDNKSIGTDLGAENGDINELPPDSGVPLDENSIVPEAQPGLENTDSVSSAGSPPSLAPSSGWSGSSAEGEVPIDLGGTEELIADDFASHYARDQVRGQLKEPSIPASETDSSPFPATLVHRLPGQLMSNKLSSETKPVNQEQEEGGVSLFFQM